MTKARCISSLLCKLLGLYLLYSVVIGLPYMLSMPREITQTDTPGWVVIGAFFGSLLMYAIVGVLLWRFSECIASRIFPGNGDTVGAAISAPRLMAIGLAVIGTLVIIDAFARMSYAAAYYILQPVVNIEAQNTGVASLLKDYKPRLYQGQLVDGVVGLVTGLGLITWSRKLAGFLFRPSTGE